MQASLGQQTCASTLSCVVGFGSYSVFNLSFSHLESKVQQLESQQRGELESMREEKDRLQVGCPSRSSVLASIRHGVTG